ncbi:MAG: hypothetical protein KTR21_12555 [Rhodobacteraceae bacterium]|nr:hypothetical protein [Paracoccaceae bacterium]
MPNTQPRTGKGDGDETRRPLWRRLLYWVVAAVALYVAGYTALTTPFPTSLTIDGQLEQITERGAIVSGRLTLREADRLQHGMPAEVLFSAPDLPEATRLPGAVARISVDAKQDEHSDARFWPLQVELAETPGLESSLQKLRTFRGLSVRIHIDTGERSLLSYSYVSRPWE